MFHDAATGSLMYRVEKESSEPADGAELIAIHVNAAYCRRLLSYIQSQEGGELGAKGCMLLIRGATLASDSAVTVPLQEAREGFPDPRRPTKHNPEGSKDWQSEHPDLTLQSQGVAAKIVSENLDRTHKAMGAYTRIAAEDASCTPVDEADTPPLTQEPELF
nr:MAG TPA: hypothetical protein [Caudoviricetes sp.]